MIHFMSNKISQSDWMDFKCDFYNRTKMHKY